MKYIREICREVQRKWDYKLTLLKRGVSYSCKFPCPKCGKEARETVKTLVTGKGVEDERWLFRWSSRCGHVRGEEKLVVAVAVPVEENGVEVGVIEAIAPPEWPRYEVSRNGQTNYNLPCAWFGSLWQAKHASLHESRILARAQRTINPNKYISLESWEATPSRKGQRST